MSLTIEQLKDLGFKDSRKSTGFSRKFNTLIYPLNKTDYLYFGFDYSRKEINKKIVWKSFVNIDGERISYIITNLSNTGYNEMKAFLKREHMNSNYKPTEEEQKFLDGEMKDDFNFILKHGGHQDTSEYFKKLQENGEDVEESDPVFIKII